VLVSGSIQHACTLYGPSYTHSAIFALAFQPADFGTYFLAILLSNFILLLLYYVITKCLYKERPPLRAGFFFVLSIICWAVGIVFYTQV
jgi:4-amino-4-deoxy-L-arabinose transferase-like glycosyltransferase